MDSNKADLNVQLNPSIISEIRLDYTEMFKLNQRIVELILNSDLDLVGKTSILNNLLPGLIVADTCACSCSCSCSCCGGGSILTSQAGRVS